MTHHAETTLKMSASADKVWRKIQDFSSVECFSSKVKSSPIVSDIQVGLGAQRRCTLYDGSSILEEIVEYRAGESLRIAVSELSLPLRSLVANMRVLPVSTAICAVTFGMDYVVKYGAAGWLVGQLIVKPMIRNLTRDVLLGLAYHVVTGGEVGAKLPAKSELASVLA